MATAAQSVLSSLKLTKEDILRDFRIANESRHASFLGRREVLTGKAKFGIFGDGKEIPQLAMARAFQDGDWRSGYYRDQTFMFATEMMTLEEFFAQLYGDTDLKANPASGGRLMNNHFGTRSLDENGHWKDLTKQKNSSCDTSPTASQMPRLLGLASASKHFKALKDQQICWGFSKKGNEVAFGTIGDASTSEGHFFETINAAGVLQVPMALSVWDDQWGISVPNKFQTTKGNISGALAGFQKEKDTNGIEIFRANAFDYPQLIETYRKGVDLCRKNHVPVLFHIIGCTQPQGHSTSGSHERYKTPEQLQDEKDRDGITRMRQWILEEGIATEKDLETIENEAMARVREAKKNAWKNFQDPIKKQRSELLQQINMARCACVEKDQVEALKKELAQIEAPILKDVMSVARKALRQFCNSCDIHDVVFKNNVRKWLNARMDDDHQRYSSFLYSQSEWSALKIKSVPPAFEKDAEMVPGREILRDNFKVVFENNPLVVAFGEDVGKIGGVNQTYEGLQKIFGENRIFDTGIREATIIGQGIGMALRGFRPIAEIQYFDYLLYGLQVISDDLATTHYRSHGGQKAPMIISTRGHRLEGIWHSGSPMGMLLSAVRGVHVAVPRDMTQAAGFYNTYLASDQPVVIIEPLNGYRLRERKPSNMGEFRTPVGIPEILQEGTDLTLVTYGSCVRIAREALKQLMEFDISVELIDVQTLIPFDVEGVIYESLKKTNKILFFDEDVPGGATTYMLQKVLEARKGFFNLDLEPRTLTARSHRAAYSTDGDYFSNPNAEDVFETVYQMMHEYHPSRYPGIF
jgi:pyruvate/2-oxoglutarate/acetoin dehydrogenase E1 component/TPP-dependent pyruvate/acetoin dehydrogenase alpha subunit